MEVRAFIRVCCGSQGFYYSLLWKSGLLLGSVVEVRAFIRVCCGSKGFY